MTEVWTLFGGCVTIHIQGPGLDRWLATAQKAGIRFLFLERPAYTQITATLPLAQLPRTAALLDERQTLRELSRRGLIPTLTRAARAWPSLLCLALAAAWLLFASGRLWSLEVESPDPVLSGRVAAWCAHEGLTPGTELESLDLRAWERRVLSAFPELRFCEIVPLGTRLTLRALPLEIPSEETEASALCARWDGVVEKVTVTSGRSLVEPGDAVHSGQRLIEGLTDPTPDLASPRKVPAQGEVTARVWISATAAEADLPEMRTLERVEKRYALALRDTVFPLYREDGDDAWLLTGETGLAGPWKRCPLRILTYARRQYGSLAPDASAVMALLGQTCFRQIAEAMEEDAELVRIMELPRTDETGRMSLQIVCELRMNIAVPAEGT